jgi:IS5 family transposase
VESIGKGKASAPYEFGVKASVVTTTIRRGSPAARSSAPMSIKGYRGHDVENPHRVFISGRKGVFGCIKRELRRRSAIEAVIGHMKTDSHLGRCHLKGRDGDAANVILSTVGYNLRLVLAWLRIILRDILLALLQGFASRPAVKSAF